MNSYLYFILFISLFASCTKDIVENDVTDTVAKDTIVKVTPKACFEYTRSSIISALDTVQFSNCSSNSDLYKWDFGDGTTSVEKNPMHIFKIKGVFKVKLLATKGTASDTISKSINIPYYADGQIVNLSMSRYDSSLDFEGDGIVDLQFSFWDNAHSSTYEKGFWVSSDTYLIHQNYYYQKYFSYIPKNPQKMDCKLDTILRIDTLSIPKINIFGDTLKNQLGIYKQSKLTMCKFNFTSGCWGGGYENCSIWVKDEIRYIGFQKRYGNIVKIGWLKLKLLGSPSISDQISKLQLISYMVPKETESLIIDK